MKKIFHKKAVEVISTQKSWLKVAQVEALKMLDLLREWPDVIAENGDHGLNLLAKNGNQTLVVTVNATGLVGVRVEEKKTMADVKVPFTLSKK